MPPRLLRSFGFFATLILALSVIIVFPRVDANAAEGVDLTAQLNGTEIGVAGGDYTFVATFRNIGTEATMNPTIRFTMPEGSEYHSESCTTTGGAQCPTDTVLPQGTISSGQSATATIPLIPTNSSVQITFKGKFPFASSAAVSLSITPASGVTDNDLASNEVHQHARLNTDAEVTIEKEQNVEQSVTGTDRIYTVTYTNKGPLDLPNLRIADVLHVPSFASLPGVGVRWTVHCDQEASGSTECPTWANGDPLSNSFTNDNGVSLFDSQVNLPKNQKLVLKVTANILATCSRIGDSFELTNVAFQKGALGYNVIGEKNSPAVSGTVTGVPACQNAEVTKGKTQDREDVRLGETRTYTVVYENTSDLDITGMKVRELYTSPEASALSVNGEQLVNGLLRWSVSCDPANTSDGACPDWATGVEQTRSEMRSGDLFNKGGSWSEDGSTDKVLNLKAHQKVTFTIPMVVTGLCRPSPEFNVNNTALQLGSPELNVDTIGDASVSGRIIDIPACDHAELIVNKTADKEVSFFGDTINYTITYTNNGPSDIRNVYVRDDMNFFQHYDVNFAGGEVTYHCDNTSTAACPFHQGPQTRRIPADSLNKTPNVFGEYAQIPKGEKLIIRASFRPEGTCTPHSDTLLVRNKASYNLGSVEYIGNSNGEDGSTVDTKILCNDVTTNTHLSDATPDSGEPLTITSTIANTLGTAENLPITIALPSAAGFLLAPGTQPACASETADLCPTQWNWDPQARTFKATLPKLRAGESLVVTIPGTTGVVPLGGESYRVTTTAPSLGDKIPGAENTNRSDDTFVNQNSKVKITVTHTLISAPEDVAPSNLEFTARLKCDHSGTHDLSATIPQGKTQAEISIPDAVWKHDRCEFTAAKPTSDLPDGYAWLPLEDGTPENPGDRIIPAYSTDLVFPYHWRIGRSVVLPQPQVVDVCGPNNIVWAPLEDQPIIPEGAYTWSKNDAGQLVATFSPGFVAKIGSPTVFDLPADSDIACASVTVRTWTDPLEDGEGERTPLSLPISPVSVSLISVADDGAETQLSTAQTTDGTYTFADLAAGTYYVRFDSIPEGYEITRPTTAGSPTDSATDSDNFADALNPTGRSTQFRVTDGTTTVVDAGYKPLLGSISGLVWADTNNDGVRNDNTDPLTDERLRIQNVTVTLLNENGQPVRQNGLGQAVQPVTTALDGTYSFTDLPAGTYKIAFTAQDPALQLTQHGTADNSTNSDPLPGGVTDNIQLDVHSPAARHITHIDAGYFVRIPDYEKEGELRKAVTLSLNEQKTGQVVNHLDPTTIVYTQENKGTLSDDGKTLTVPGEGTWTIDLNTGAFTFSPDPAFVGDPTPVRYSGSTATGIPPVEPGTVTVYYPAALGDKVYEDVNRDGIFNEGDKPLADVSVTFTGSDGQILTATTDADGYYLIAVLPGVEYTATFSHNGYMPSVIPDESISGEHRNTVNEQGTVIVPPLNKGEKRLTVDAAFVQVPPPVTVPPTTPPGHTDEPGGNPGDNPGTDPHPSTPPTPPTPPVPNTPPAKEFPPRVPPAQGEQQSALASTGVQGSLVPTITTLLSLGVILMLGKRVRRN